ncbi:MAG TPA: diacylglycerol kinase family protein [Pyrinomonadaceae bacterium]|nr:diacylglycerol kinase family protein [Pyrinomonadaceae bacterium]
MTTRRAIIISNPKTGRYATRRIAPIEEICAQLKAQNLDVELINTTGPGHATRIAEAAARNGTSDVIVAGGDGTINEALQGLVGSPARLSVLPRGTANVLARDLGLPLDCGQAAEVIVRAKTRRIHVGCAVDEKNGVRRYFLLMAGIGLDASVVSGVHPGLKKRLGRGAFWLSGLSHLADWKLKTFEIEIAGNTFVATFATIGKAATYGGELSVTPRAQLDQPDFEICVVTTQSRVRYLQLLSHALRSGVPQDKPGVHFLRASHARASGEANVQVDGEVIGSLPMTFQIAPETIDVIVP